MEISLEDYSLLKQLEESLWQSETRFDIDYMNQILSLNFFEFGRSGKTYKREDTLAAPAQKICASLPLKDFRVYLIDEQVALVTYVSLVTNKDLEIGNRSSIWSKKTGKWLLHFHQGTPTTLVKT